MWLNSSYFTTFLGLSTIIYTIIIDLHQTMVVESAKRLRSDDHIYDEPTSCITGGLNFETYTVVNYMPRGCTHPLDYFCTARGPFHQ